MMMMMTMTMMFCYSVGRTARQESTVRSSRNPISKPMRRQSGKLRISGSKVTPNQLGVSVESAVNGSVGTSTLGDCKTYSRTERSTNRKVDSSMGEQLDGLDIGAADMFHSPLAERVKLRRMSQPDDVDESVSGADKIDGSKSKTNRSTAEKASAAKKVPVAGKRNLLNRAAKSVKELSHNNMTKNVCVKKWPGTVKLALTKKNSAVKLSKTNCAPVSIKPGAERSVRNQQAGNSETAHTELVADMLKRPSKKLAEQKLKPKMTISVSPGLKQKSVAPNAKRPERSVSVKDSGVTAVEVAEMPRLKANNKQHNTTAGEKKMPVLQQETSLAQSNQSTKMSPRKRQQPSQTTTKSKLPKLSPVEERSRVAEKRGCLRNNDAGAGTLSCDDDMPQLSAVELTEKTKPLRVVVGQFDSPPELDRSPLCDVDTTCAEQKQKLSLHSPARCLRDNKDAALKTSPRNVKTELSDDASRNETQKHSAARSKHRADLSPVSTRTALSQNNCSIPSQIAVTQTVCRMSSQHSKVAVMQTKGSVSPQPVSVMQINCSTSSQPCIAPLKQTDSDIGSTHETQPEDGCLCTEMSSEMVPYIRPTNNVSGQWQVPCGVPMPPFIITGMYPMMGSGYGCQMMSLPPLVTPAMPAATAVISNRGGSLPSPRVQYHLPVSAASPVVPLYMSPIVGPLMQPGASSSQVNLMPFVPSLPHATAAVHSQPSSTTLLLRPPMLPAGQLYTLNCMLASQQQQVNLSSRRSVDVTLLRHLICLCVY